MVKKSILNGKKILIIDDEEDVLGILVDLLDMCKVDTANSFENGKILLENNDYDAAVLDIMGVNGFELLKICLDRKIAALMLTAHSLTPESLKESYQNGASYFVPKEKMTQIDIYLRDVLEAKEQKKDPWTKWFDRLVSFFDTRFSGPDWRDKEREYFKKKIKAKISIPGQDED